LLIALFIAVTVYSVWVGLRQTVYFVIFAALFMTSILLLLANPNKRKNTAFIVLFTLVLLSVTQSVTPILENRLVIFGSDQWRDIVGTDLIIKQGNYWGAATYSGVYYASIPLFTLLNSVVTLTAGNVFWSFAILVGLMGLVMALAVYLIVLRITKSYVASTVGVFIFLSTPRLALVQAIPATLSLVLGAVLVFLMVNCISLPRRGLFAAFLVIAFSTVIFNVVGVVVIIGLCAGLLIVNFLGLSTLTFPQLRMTRYLFVSTVFLSLIYWAFNNIVFNSILSPLRRLLVTATPTYSGVAAISTPRYFTGGFEVYSYSWAFPVGISAAYVLLAFYTFIQRRHRRGRDAFRTLPFVTGLVGLLLIVVGFASILNAPSASVERYVNNVAYLLILIPTALVSSILISDKRKIAVVCILTLLVVSVYVGCSSPDWTPFESPTFTAIRVSESGLAEAKQIINLLPNGLTIYEDYDIPVAPLCDLSNLLYNSPSSYQVTRSIIDAVKSGVFNPFEAAYATGKLNPIYLVKTDEVQNGTAINLYMNTLYDSGLHVMLKTPQ
jgi:hypothetical protein